MIIHHVRCRTIIVRQFIAVGDPVQFRVYTDKDNKWRFGTIDEHQSVWTYEELTRKVLYEFFGYRCHVGSLRQLRLSGFFFWVENSYVEFSVYIVQALSNFFLDNFFIIACKFY
jgi:hypothetical protein